MTKDFAGLVNYLRPRHRELLPTILPGGRLVGGEYTCGSLSGGQGDSFKFNIETGKWCDFATGEKGGDIISLYAAVENITNPLAFDALAEKYSFGGSFRKPIDKFVPVPEYVDPPDWGKPSAIYEYKSAQDKLLYYIVRYDDGDSKKFFVPWSYTSNNGWVKKAWSKRTLFGLELLLKKPDLPVMIVEGEKACLAARVICGRSYNVLTWQGGAKAVDKTDFTILAGKSVVLWPDRDRHKVKTLTQSKQFGLEIGDEIPYAFQAGTRAMYDIAKVLVPICSEVKILNVFDEVVDGWDAADALALGWKQADLIKWAKPRVELLSKEGLPSNTPQAGRVPVQKEAPAQPSKITLAVIESSVPADFRNWQAWKSIGIKTSENGSPFVNINNAIKVFEYFEEFKDLVWFDEFHQKFFTTWRSEQTREWTEHEELALTLFMQKHLEIEKMSVSTVRDAIHLYAKRNIKNEPKDWLTSLQWDEVRRLDTFLIDAFGVKDTEYSRQASKNFWISMVARIMRPGCKVDQMMILEGGQGMFKSTALDIIGGPWYGVCEGDMESKDFIVNMQGKLLMEMAELESFNRSDVNTIKRLLSTRIDRVRLPYGRYSQDLPRQGIFVGTTNKEEYLGDSTGGRRFIPHEVKRVDLDFIKNFRSQFFAEALVRFKMNESWWELPDEAFMEQEARREHDEWEDVIADWLIGKSRVTSIQIAIGALGLKEAKDFDRRMQLRMSNVMRVVGWKKAVLREDGLNRKFWVKS